MATTPSRPSTFDMIISNGDDHIQPPPLPSTTPAAPTTTPAQSEQRTGLLNSIASLYT